MEYTLQELLNSYEHRPGPCDPDDVIIHARMTEDGDHHLCDIRAQLTTRRAESRYGQPVLVIEGRAYGPADKTPYGPAYLLVFNPRSNEGLWKRWNRLCVDMCGKSGNAMMLEECFGDPRLSLGQCDPKEKEAALRRLFP